MKHRTIAISIMILGVCLLSSGCRTGARFALYDPYMVSSELLTSARLWYNQNIDPQASKIQKYGKLQAYWDKARIMQTKDSSLLLVVPAEDFEMENEYFTFKRFVIFTVSNTRATNGKIIELVGQHYNVEENYELLIQNQEQPEIADFNGSIICYDVSYREIKSTTYKKGHRADNVYSSFITMPASRLKTLMNAPVQKKIEDVRKY